MLGLTIAFGAVCVVLVFLAGCGVGALRERRLVQAVIEQGLARKINVLEQTIDDVIDLNRKTSLRIKAVEGLVPAAINTMTYKYGMYSPLMALLSAREGNVCPENARTVLSCPLPSE